MGSRAGAALPRSREHRSAHQLEGFPKLRTASTSVVNSRGSFVHIRTAPHRRPVRSPPGASRSSSAYPTHVVAYRSGSAVRARHSTGSRLGSASDRQGHHNLGDRHARALHHCHSPPATGNCRTTRISQSTEDLHHTEGAARIVGAALPVPFQTNSLGCVRRTEDAARFRL